MKSVINVVAFAKLLISVVVSVRLVIVVMATGRLVMSNYILLQLRSHGKLCHKCYITRP